MSSYFELCSPPVLWHYTSPSGLAGVVSTGEVWATVIHYLNDEREFQHALDLFRKAIDSVAKEQSPSAQTALSAAKDSLNQISGVNVCVFSLSEYGDLLSQWRAYCPPDGGYSIAMRTAILSGILEKQGFRLVKCTYDESFQFAIAKHMMEEFAIEYTQKYGQEDCTVERFRAELSSPLLYKICSVAPCFKHPSFAEEREWRAISQPISWEDSAFSTRITSNCIVPHYRLKIHDEQHNDVISQIIVGPSKNQKLASRSVNFLSNQAKLRLGSVALSHTPYRNL
jgi:hypothetical protein